MKNEMKVSTSTVVPKFTLFQKIVFTIFGYPPRPEPLPDEVWENWKARYDSEHYDFSRHSGKTGKHSS